MSCDDVRPHLSEYFDGEAAPEVRTELIAHLSGCVRCQDRLDEWIIISEKVYRSSTVKAPPFLWTRVLAKIKEQEAGAPEPWWQEWRWMRRVTVAAMVLVSLGAVYVLNSTAPLESLLEGQPEHHRAIHMASRSRTSDAEIVVANLILEPENER